MDNLTATSTAREILTLTTTTEERRRRAFVECSECGEDFGIVAYIFDDGSALTFVRALADGDFAWAAED